MRSRALLVIALLLSAGGCSLGDDSKPVPGDYLCGIIPPSLTAAAILGQPDADVVWAPLIPTAERVIGCEYTNPEDFKGSVLDVVVTAGKEFGEIKAAHPDGYRNLNGVEMVDDPEHWTVHARFDDSNPLLIGRSSPVESTLTVGFNGDTDGGAESADQLSELENLAQHTIEKIGSRVTPSASAETAGPVLVDDRGHPVPYPVVMVAVYQALVTGDTTPFEYDDAMKAQLPMLQQPSIRAAIARSMTTHPHCENGCTYPGFAVTGWAGELQRNDGAKLGVDPARVPDPRLGAGLPVYASVFLAPPSVGWKGMIAPGGSPETAIKEILPVDTEGRPHPGWRVIDHTADIPGVDCSANQAATGARSGDVYACSPVAANAGTCWKATNPKHVLCLADPTREELIELVAEFPATAPATYVDRPEPIQLDLDNGDVCILRTGGSWGRPAGTDYFGFYACTKTEAVWGPEGQGIDTTGKAWTVITGNESGPLTRHRVATAYFVATAP